MPGGIPTVMQKSFTLLLVVAGLSACVSMPAPDSPTTVGEVEFRQLAPGVWMHSAHADIAPYGPVVSNGLIVVEGRQSRLIDTAWNDAQTASILAFARDRLGAPIANAVFTHAHADKMSGVGLLRSRGIATYALQLTNRRAPAEGVLPAEHDLVLADDGTPAAFGTVRIAWPGAGHAPDNIVVWLPESRILFGGCMIRPAGSTGLGNTGDADIAHWDDATETVQWRFPAAKTVVPSHGDPGGPELLDLTIALARAAGPAAD